MPVDLGMDPAEVLAPATEPSPPGGPPDPAALTINWVLPPPSIASGGFGTIFRLIRLLEARGHDSRVYIQFGTRPQLARYRDLVHANYGVRAAVFDAGDGMDPADAIFATHWTTAYTVRNSPAPGRRFYLVQDFEPLFFPASSRAVLAEETYRFGFHGITAGRWLAAKLSHEYGMSCDSFDLGVDLDCYRLDNAGARDGVVFFARPDTPRRGFELGMMALELFAHRRPGTEIHLVGQPIRWAKPSFRFTDHGTISRPDLAALYNRCSAGLVLSLTNISLVPSEMLAAGCIPVMNDGVHIRAAYDNPNARFAKAMPGELATALCAAVDGSAPDLRRSAAASVAGLSWDLVAGQFEAGLQRGLGLGSPTDA